VTLVQCEHSSNILLSPTALFLLDSDDYPGGIRSIVSIPR